MDKFVIYLVTYHYSPDFRHGHIIGSETNQIYLRVPSESILMIPPIGWDCE